MERSDSDLWLSVLVDENKFRRQLIDQVGPGGGCWSGGDKALLGLPAVSSLPRARASRIVLADASQMH